MFRFYFIGQETIGTILLTESLSNSGINLEKTGEVNPSVIDVESSSSSSGSSGGGSSSITNVYNIYNNITEETEDNEISDDSGEVGGRSWLTGGVIGTNLLAGSSLVFVIAIIGAVLIAFIISRTMIKLKKNKHKVIYKN